MAMPLLSYPSPTKLIVMVRAKDVTYISQYLHADIAGCFLKDEINEAIVHLIRAVAGGHTCFSRAVMEQMLATTMSQVIDEKNAHLTASERRVLLSVLQGWDNAKIAHELHLAEQTVRNYITNIYTKLGIHSRTELVVRFGRQVY